MEEAILKTLIYADIFNYPLKTYEIHKWLIGKKVSLREIEKGLTRLIKKRKIEGKKEYYFLYGKSLLISKREKRLNQSLKYLQIGIIVAILFKLVPWVKLVGISGNLSMENASKEDDIDLFIITSKDRLWISRLLLLGLLSMIRKRRKRGDSFKKSAGKICINLLLEEDKLEQYSKDIYLAHEVLQMKVLWQRDGMYYRYLADNQWAFKFLPNWIGSQYQVSNGKYSEKNRKFINDKYLRKNNFIDVTEIFEHLAKKFQLWHMKKPQGMENIQDGALYFHPKDYRKDILKDYRKRVAIS